MALILEVLQPGRSGEVRLRQRVGESAITIGRGLDNALILDDPHVDARHARLERGEDGSLVLADLGSVNGVLTAEGRAARIPVGHGTVVTLGRTTLRFRDELAAVPPAVPLTAPLDGREGGAARAPWERTPVRIAFVLGALGFAALDSWLGATERGAATMNLGMIIALAVVLSLWAGSWGVASRAVRGQFQFLRHAAIGALGFSAWLALETIDEWGQFFFPAATVFAPVQSGLMLLLLAALVAGHLGAASHLSLLQRWRVGAVASGVVLLLMGSFALLDDDQFTPAAEFSGVIKSAHPTLVPTQSVEEFSRTIVDLRSEIDSLLATDAARR